MTIQAGDILSYNGKKTTIATEPLKTYLETRSDVGFIFKSTALVRGYIGNWKIKNKMRKLALSIYFQIKPRFLQNGSLETLEFQRGICLKKSI
jgi:hypothetical protein